MPKSAVEAVQIDVGPRLTVGERVLLIRLVRGMTQSYIANRLGCHQVRISQLELSDGLAGLYFDKFVELVQLLNTTSDYLLGLSDVLYLKKSDLPRYRFVLGYVMERRLNADIRWIAYCRQRSFAPDMPYKGSNKAQLVTQSPGAQ